MFIGTGRGSIGNKVISTSSPGYRANADLGRNKQVGGGNTVKEMIEKNRNSNIKYG